MLKLAEQPWSWTLFQAGDELILSVLSGGVATAEVNVTLSENETAAWRRHGRDGLKELVDQIQRRPADFTDRHRPLSSEDSA